MSRLAILFSCAIFAQGLIRRTADLSGFQDNNLETVISRHDVAVSDVRQTSLWVLVLDTEDLDRLKLRVGTADEDREFEVACGNSVRQMERIRLFGNRRVKKDNPVKQNDTALDTETDYKEENEQLKTEILKVVNKFILSTVDLSNDVATRAPTVSLYFKGPYTSLVVRSGIKQWHFFIRPPSPLPSWFYTSHPPGGVDVLPVVRHPFYASLSRLLQMLLRVAL